MKEQTKTQYYAVDIVLIWFCGLLLAQTLFFYSEIPNRTALLALYACGLLLGFAFPWATSGLVVSQKLLVRTVGLCILIPILFSSLGFLVHHISPDDRHWQLLNWDRRIFGGDPVRFVQRLGTPVLTDLIQFCYAAYYFLPMVLGFFLFRSKRWDEYQALLAVIAFGFFVSYLGYFLVPARSPNEVLPGFWQEGLWIANALAEWTRQAEWMKRSAFPSGHLMLTLITVVLAWKLDRRAFYWILPFALGLSLATVYLGYHYLVDLIAGAALGVLVLVFAKPILEQASIRCAPQ